MEAQPYRQPRLAALSGWPASNALVCAIVCGMLWWPAPARADGVTQWTRLADDLGHGSANWRTLVIMHQAMHDAWNAARPTYQRWYPPTSGEPPGANAQPEAAMAAAARRVVLWLHPEGQAAADRLFRAELAGMGDSPSTRAGLMLGEFIADAAVERRRDDGFQRRHRFEPGNAPGQWRPTPQEFESGGTTATRPFLFARATDFAARPPPPPGSDAFRKEMLEVMLVGGDDPGEHSPAQTEAAQFWAFQSSQRGFVALGAAMLDAHKRPGGLAEHARVMSQLTAAMADSAILVWIEKEQVSRWRPVTAIRQMVADGDHWLPLIDTPPHPEYPSGHAADCFTGAGFLRDAFPDMRGAIVYVALSGRPENDTVGMGQHAQGRNDGDDVKRVFPSFDAAAVECSNSRIWAGAHFRSSETESHRLADEVVRRASAAVPRLP